jgi:hypothetical protein
MWSAPRLYHASYQLPAAVPHHIHLSTTAVLVQIHLSIVQFQELTSCEKCSVKERTISAEFTTVVLEDTRLCVIKREIVCYNCCV